MPTDYATRLDDLLESIIKEGASDLHLSVDRHPTVRISGTLLPMVNQEVLTEADTEGFLKQLLTSVNQKEFEENKEIDLSLIHI